LGATFDESLVGIIRVSVVATGVDINAANNVPARTGPRTPFRRATRRRRRKLACKPDAPKGGAQLSSDDIDAAPAYVSALSLGPGTNSTVSNSSN
jgi:hypothetical protein